jgi:hypothetical protein
MAMAPKANGRRVATRATDAALIGENPRPHEHHGGDGDRRAEAGQASRRAPKQNAMMIACTRWSSEMVAKRSAQDREMTALDGHVVDQIALMTIPHDRKQAERRAEQR